MFLRTIRRQAVACASRWRRLLVPPAEFGSSLPLPILLRMQRVKNAFVRKPRDTSASAIPPAKAVTSNPRAPLVRRLKSDIHVKQKPRSGHDIGSRYMVPPSLLLDKTNPRFWSHELYHARDLEAVKVVYTNNLADSERLAQEFLHERVLGFDMEWPWYFMVNGHTRCTPGTRRKIVSLVQIASEDKIGLFHIAFHKSATMDCLIPPSLRKIIESPDIAKAGVGIMGEDFPRLKKYFDLNPQGGFELSHLHNLITFGETDPEKCTTRLVKLTSLVEQHLGGLPLNKQRALKMSDWSRRLRWEQMHYAASDAYAGFKLYQCMDARRLLMSPTPPLPVPAENYRTEAWTAGPDRIIRFPSKDGTPQTVYTFYNVLPLGLRGIRQLVTDAIQESDEAANQALVELEARDIRFNEIDEQTHARTSDSAIKTTFQ